jgi:hypothetical protein
VQAGATRLHTLQLLAASGLLFGRHKATPTVSIITEDAAGGDVEELEGSDSGENVLFLMHFYAEQPAGGGEEFIAAAVYELVSLAFNAVWAGLVASVRARKRQGLSSWCQSAVKNSPEPKLWTLQNGGFPISALPHERTALRRLLPSGVAARLYEEPTPKRVSEVVTTGLMLAAKVVARESSRRLLNTRLRDTELVELLQYTLLSERRETLGRLLSDWVNVLIDRHEKVSDRKGKEVWIRNYGNEMRAVDAHQMALGFHSYRMPQIISLIRDVRMERRDLKHV